MRTLRTVTLIAALCATAGLAQAATPYHRSDWTPGIDQRQANQEARIRHGLATGALTRHEARRLFREQREISRFEAFAKSDGVVTRHERWHLVAMLDDADRDIARQTHDRETRGHARY